MLTIAFIIRCWRMLWIDDLLALAGAVVVGMVVMWVILQVARYDDFPFTAQWKHDREKENSNEQGQKREAGNGADEGVCSREDTSEHPDVVRTNGQDHESSGVGDAYPVFRIRRSAEDNRHPAVDGRSGASYGHATSGQDAASTATSGHGEGGKRFPPESATLKERLEWWSSRI